MTVEPTPLVTPPAPPPALPEPQTEVAPPVAPPIPPDGQVRFFRTLAGPFLDKPWHWVPNILAVVGLSYVPVLGWMVSWGWTLAITRRYRTDPRAALPRWDGVGGYLRGWLHFLLCGFFVWVVGFLFYTLPCVLLATGLFIKELIEKYNTVNGAFKWAYAWWQGKQTSDGGGGEWTGERIQGMVVGYVADNAGWLGLKVGVTVLCFCLAQMVFAGGVVRYARSGSVWTFLHPFHNLWFVFRYWPAFCKAVVCWLMMMALVGLLWVVLALVGVGVIFIPVAFALQAWFMGYLYGQVAAYVDQQLARAPA